MHNEKNYARGYSELCIGADHLDFDLIEKALGVKATRCIKQNKANCDYWLYEMPEQELTNDQPMIDFLMEFCTPERIKAINAIREKFDAVVDFGFVIDYHKPYRVGICFEEEFTSLVSACGGRISVDQYLV